MVMAEMPRLDEVAGSVDVDTPVFRQLGRDGVVRELAAALVRHAGDTYLVLVDRSSETGLREWRRPRPRRRGAPGSPGPTPPGQTGLPRAG